MRMCVCVRVFFQITGIQIRTPVKGEVIGSNPSWERRYGSEDRDKEALSSSSPARHKADATNTLVSPEIRNPGP